MCCSLVNDCSSDMRACLIDWDGHGDDDTDPNAKCSQPFSLRHPQCGDANEEDTFGYDKIQQILAGIQPALLSKLPGGFVASKTSGNNTSSLIMHECTHCDTTVPHPCGY